MLILNQALKLKKRNKKSDLLLDELKNKALYPVNNKRVIPIVTGYFPEDFSLIPYSKIYSTFKEVNNI